MTKDKIIDEEIRQAVKELSNLLEEFDLTEVQIENNKIGKIKVAKNSFIPQSSNIASNQNRNDVESRIEKPKIQMMKMVHQNSKELPLQKKVEYSYKLVIFC